MQGLRKGFEVQGEPGETHARPHRGEELQLSLWLWRLLQEQLEHEETRSQMSEQSDGSLREGVLCISPIARKNKNVQTLEEFSSLNINIRPGVLVCAKKCTLCIVS